MAPVGHTSEQRVHSGRQKPRSYDMVGCMNFSGSVLGRNTSLGHAATQSWHAVQWRAMLVALRLPGGVSGVVRWGATLSVILANPPSTVLPVCALAAAVAAMAAVRRQPLRGGLSVVGSAVPCCWPCAFTASSFRWSTFASRAATQSRHFCITSFVGCPYFSALCSHTCRQSPHATHRL